MDIISKHVRRNYVAQGDSCEHHDINDTHSLTQSVVSGSSSITLVPEVDNSNRDFYYGYSYVNNYKSLPGVFNDVPLQGYAIKCGYQFTEDFISIMCEHRIDFLERVDRLLSDSSNSFSLLKGIVESEETVDLKGKICSFFYDYMYKFRSKCVDILRSDIIPIVIASIFNCKIVIRNNDRIMTYPEMERLFLYFVRSLENLIVVNLIKHWHNFCSEIHLIPSLTSGIDYSNLLSYDDCFYRVSLDNITYPAAFARKFGKYISFMAVSKIDEMISNFMGKFVDELENFFHLKCYYIYNYSDSVVSDLVNLKSESRYLVRKEFDKKVVEDGFKDSFSDFLSKLLIWDRHEVRRNTLLVFEEIDSFMRNLLEFNYFNRFLGTIKVFQKRAWRSKLHVSKGGKRFTIKDKWGVNLHHEDDYKILSIRRKFVAKSKNVIRSKFSYMLKEKYEFSDGTVISAVGWGKISKKLFPIAQETIRDIFDDERVELLKVLSNVRIFDDLHVGTRCATCEEKNSILKTAIKKSERQMKDTFRLVWISLINGTKNTVSKHVDSGCELIVQGDNVVYDDVSSRLVPTIDNVSSLVDVSSAQGELPAVSAVPMELNYASLGFRVEQIISMWGLNIHPDDDRIILFTRRSFSAKIMELLRELFSDMLEREAVLPSGRVISRCAWKDVSSELYPIAIDSIESLVEDQYSELDRIFSKVRVVDVNRDNDSFCIVREVTAAEKNDLMVRVRVIVGRGLKYSVRSSWLSVISSFESYKFYRRETSVWGLKLRYCDNSSILNTRKKYSSKIRLRVYDKFSKMISDKYTFDDGTTIGRFAWFRVSKKMYPIAMSLVKDIIDGESRELEEVISKSRVVTDYKTDREITDEEKSNVLEKIMKVVFRELKNLFGKIWLDILSSLEDDHGGVEVCEEYTKSFEFDCTDIENKSSTDIFGIDSSAEFDAHRVNLRNEDDNNISRLRSEFLSKINSCINIKFSEILEKEKVGEFDNRKITDRFSWKKMSDKLLPIAKKEIGRVMEGESVKINNILLESRMVVYGNDGCTVDRDLTSEEISSFLGAIVKSAYEHSICESRKLWMHLISSSDGGTGDLSFSASSGDVQVLKLYYEDDRAILNVRRRFSSKLNCCISAVFRKIIKKEYEFGDRDISDRLSWKVVSKKILPIAKKEMDPILREERMKIKDLLLKSRKVFSGGGGYSEVRELNNEEVLYIIEDIMKSVYRQSLDMLRRVWRRVSRLSKVDIMGMDDKNMNEILDLGKECSSFVNFANLSELYKEEFDDIRLEFIGSLGPIVAEVVGSSLLNIDVTPSILDRIKSDVVDGSCSLFKEGGFIDRVELLLSEIQVIRPSGKDRFLTEDEKRSIFQEFTDNIAIDRDCFVDNRIVRLVKNIDPTKEEFLLSSAC
ncbi:MULTISPECIES: hypothetical protein [Candidatus Ichthyocystis]|uniref:Uncharacterized protein n=1 Tax=Candidatus Ichthyocystis hellenicum TaxID=1561003 RepID=A0A0S4M3W5_9BURK|nr:MULTISPECIES: hypothetical protein [Ichthyocystis]CUT17695.1 hypothetical protein Ark11_0872 [Candidatus Ichthyocystis hellenicum]